MPTAPSTFRPFGSRSLVERRAEHDDRRGSASSRGYNERWKKARLTYLGRRPLCVCCEANGVIEPAVIVDHAVPHKGDSALFWKTELWQGLCRWCNEHVKQPIERAYLDGRAPQADLFLARPAPKGWRPPAAR